MSVGDSSLKQRNNRAKDMKKVSSPAKVYQSRASKPSAVEAVTLTNETGGDSDAADVAELNENVTDLKDKLNALIAALKK